jgi:hypothetical protein
MSRSERPGGGRKKGHGKRKRGCRGRGLSNETKKAKRARWYTMRNSVDAEERLQKVKKKASK